MVWKTVQETYIFLLKNSMPLFRVYWNLKECLVRLRYYHVTLKRRKMLSWKSIKVWNFPCSWLIGSTFTGGSIKNWNEINFHKISSSLSNLSYRLLMAKYTQVALDCVVLRKLKFNLSVLRSSLVSLLLMSGEKLKLHY